MEQKLLRKRQFIVQSTGAEMGSLCGDPAAKREGDSEELCSGGKRGWGAVGHPGPHVCGCACSPCVSMSITL